MLTITVKANYVANCHESCKSAAYAFCYSVYACNLKFQSIRKNSFVFPLPTLLCSQCHCKMIIVVALLT